MSLHLAIIGSGQLARMMALDGIPMGLSFSFLAETTEDTRCVDNLGPIVIRQPNDTADSLYDALGRPDVITVEKEHVDIDLMRGFQKHCTVHPNPNALEHFKNRLSEKRFLQAQNIPIAPFHSIKSEDDLREAAAELNKPIFLKSEEEGYDGYNQWKVTEDNLEEVIAQLEFPGQWVAESFIPFEREISFIAARASDGKVSFYPVAQNDHHHGTLLTSLIPAPDLAQDQEEAAHQYIRSIFDATDYVGVICMECFVWQGKVLVNEIAPRVHNSGHWTSHGADTSQFENHVRAVLDLPLGSTANHGISGMLNLLGATLTAAESVDENTYLTLYGKTTKPRRKLGHITVNHPDQDLVIARVNELKQKVYGDDD